MSGMKVGMSSALLPLGESNSRQQGMDFMNTLFPGGERGQAPQLDGRHLVGNEPGSVITSERLHAPASADERSQGVDAGATDVIAGETPEPGPVRGMPLDSLLAADRAMRRDTVIPRPAPAGLERIDRPMGGESAHLGMAVTPAFEHAAVRLLADVPVITSAPAEDSETCAPASSLLVAGPAVPGSMKPPCVPVAGPDRARANAVEPEPRSPAFEVMESPGLRDPAFDAAGRSVTSVVTTDGEPGGPLDASELALLRLQPAVQGSSLLYPQMLRAVGSLSHLVRSGAELDEAAETPITDGSSPVTGPFGGNGRSADAAAHVEGRVASSRINVPAPGPMQDARTRTAPSSQPVTTATLREATVAASIEWPRKLLRLVETEDGTLSCWLRDFTLDEQEARVLVAALRSAADIQGLQVRRIVINGQLAWTHSQGES